MPVSIRNFVKWLLFFAEQGSFIIDLRLWAAVSFEKTNIFQDAFEIGLMKLSFPY